MKKHIVSVLAPVIAAATLCVSPISHADKNGTSQYAVTITNLTRGQNIAPPAVVAHNGGYEMFTLGQPGLPELARLAEEGNGAPMLAVAAALPSVYKTVLGSGVIPPGKSQTIMIETTREFPEFTVAAMLGSTNDGFMAVRGVRMQNRDTVSVEAVGYDAGSEMNSEDCSYIPGPPCGDFNHNPAVAEGYVHVHAGMHGVSAGAFNPAQLDWRNPVAQVEIKRMK